MASEAHPKTLRDYFTLQRGTTYKSRLLEQPGPVLLGLATIQRNGGFRSDSLRTYGGDSPENLLVQPGELYASLKDVTQSADLLGAVAKLPIGHAPGRLTQDTVKLEPKFENVPIDYIYWLLRTPQYRTYCRAHATGTTNLGLPRDDFLAYPVPELTTARSSIVDTLAALDDKIELNQRMNETLEEMARALFKSWFVAFNPVHAKATLRNPTPNHSPLDWSVERAQAYLDGMDPGIAALFPDSFVDSELGKVPEGWEETTLDKIVLLNPETWTARKAPKTVVYVDLSNTKWGTIEKCEIYEWKDAPSRAKRVLRTGDTILGTVRPGNGSYAFIGEDGLTGSTGFAVLRPRVSRDRALVWCCATASENIERLTHLADGAAYPAVRPQVVGATKIVLPSEEIRNVFAMLCGPLIDQMETNKRQSCTLASLRDTLLPKLVSGEVRVSSRGNAARGVLAHRTTATSDYQEDWS